MGVCGLGVLSTAESLSAIVILALIASTGVFLRRLLFHPLSKYPGPWYHAVSEVPVVWSLCTGRQFAYYKKLHDQYGPIVRVAPNELSFLSARAMDDIFGYGNKKGSSTTEKDSRFSLSTKNSVPWGLINAPKDVHARLRRGLASIFTSTAVLEQEVIVQHHLDELITAFSEKCAEDPSGTALIDMVVWSNFFSFDVIGALTFGKPFGCLESRGTANVEWAQSLKKIVNMGIYEQAASRLVGEHSFLQPRVVRLLAPSEVFQSRMEGLLKTIVAISKRLATGANDDHKDFVYHVLRKNEHRNLLSEGEIQRNLTGFIVAGGETVGLTLSLWTFRMGTNREVYVKLRDLIREMFSKAEDIKWTVLKDIPYLDAVIQETFRSLGSTAQRIRVVPEGGMSVDGEVLSAGTVVAVAEYAANHSEVNFHDPFGFHPERWIDPGTTNHPNASRPFSYGPRDCLGKNVAWMELKLAIAHLLWHFDLETESVERGGKNRRWSPEKDFGHITAIAGPGFPPLWVKLTKVMR